MDALPQCRGTSRPISVLEKPSNWNAFVCRGICPKPTLKIFHASIAEGQLDTIRVVATNAGKETAHIDDYDVELSALRCRKFHGLPVAEDLLTDLLLYQENLAFFGQAGAGRPVSVIHICNM